MPTSIGFTRRIQQISLRMFSFIRRKTNPLRVEQEVTVLKGPNDLFKGNYQNNWRTLFILTFVIITLRAKNKKFYE